MCEVSKTKQDRRSRLKRADGARSPEPRMLLSSLRATSRPLIAQATRTSVTSLTALHLHPTRARNMSSLPSTMKAAQITEQGDIDVIKVSSDIPVPKPEAGTLLIAVEYSG